MNIKAVFNNKVLYSKLLILLSLIVVLVSPKGHAQSKDNYQETEKLLLRLKLNSTELEEVKKFQTEPEQAIQNLLKYYKARISVKLPVDRKLKSSGKGKSANSEDMLIADNALKHIFVGQSSYPPYFCGIDIDWGLRPVPDNEWVWQLNRMSFWGAMARAYWHTGDEKYAKEWCFQLVDWINKNKNDNDHKYAWRSIEAGIRGHNWTTLFQYFIDSPNFTPEVLVAFLNSLHDHAEYLMTTYRTKSNWGLMEAEGLAFVAMAFPEFQESERWLIEAIGRLNKEIDIQVYPDGHQRELAIGYHLGCIEWFIRTYDLAEMNGRTDLFPSSYVQKVQKMCEIPMKLCHPDGSNPQFGDSWAGKPGQHQKKFLEWAERFKRHDFLYLATDFKKGQRPDSTAYALAYSGLYSMRSSWDKNAVCMVLKCGPDGGGHSQPDNGTFELSAGGRNLMPDAGSYIYSGDPENREWFRQTKVHQTLTLDEKNSKYVPKLLLWNPGKTTDVLVVENQSYDHLTHRRSVFFVDKKYFVIVDEAIGTAVGDVDIHFQLAPGKSVLDKKKLSVHTDFVEGWNVWIQSLAQKGLEMTEEEGQVSFVYTKKEPRTALRYRLSKTQADLNVRFITLVAPYEKEIPNVKIKLIGETPIGSPKLHLEIDENGVNKTIGYTL